jgi:uncharacterized protein (DUF111 family)
VPAPATLEPARPDAAAERAGRAHDADGRGHPRRLDGGGRGSAELAVDRIGYGAGTRRWEDAPNLVRAILGRPAASDREAAWVLEANLDDLSPQLVAAALDSVLAAGALDAWVAPVTMKKGRPGHLFGALVPEAARPRVEAEIFKQTSTLGIGPRDRATAPDRSSSRWTPRTERCG